MSNKQQRSHIRQLIRSRRQGINKTEQKVAAQGLLKTLSSHPKILLAKRISIYLATDGELDASLFIQWCWQNNKEVYLPVIHPFSKGHLLFLKYQQNTPMHINAFGINEPKLDIRLIKPITQIDIMLTPLVAFDISGNRLGMGGGFYDRTLSHWYRQSNITNINTIKPYPIGIAHSCQKVDQLPIEQWDIPLPEIITPNKSYMNK